MQENKGDFGASATANAAADVGASRRGERMNAALLRERKRTMMILCHKCSGVLANEGADTSGLMGCGCISGYVRGFEVPVDRAQAIAQQIKRQDELIALYQRQGRSAREIGYVMDDRSRLRLLN